MPGIFISHSKEDRDIAENLEQAFREKKIPVCVAKACIYKNKDWPKVIAEAIAAQNLFILLWSQNAVTSKQLKFEATVATKLNKSIIPICLDNTPIPTEFAASNKLHLKNIDKTIKTITYKIATSPPARNHQNHKIIKRLTQTDTLDIDTILKIIDPSDENLQYKEKSRHPSKSNKWFEKWQTIVTFLVVLLTLLTFVLEIPEKFENFISILFGETIETTCLKGAVIDEKGGVAGVIIRIEELPEVEITTTEIGSFKFLEVPGKVGEEVRVRAYYKNERIFDQNITLPGPVIIEMEGKQ